MQRLWVWPVAPVIAAGAILLVGSEMPERLRFELNQSEFDRAVAELEDRQFEEGLIVRFEGLIGPYEISNITAVGDAVIFAHSTSDSRVHQGFIHAPNELPSTWGEVWSPTFTDLGDGWYAYHEFR